MDAPNRTTLHIHLSDETRSLIEKLLGSGLYGHSESECIDRLITQSVLRELQALQAAGMVTRDPPEEPRLPRELGQGVMERRRQIPSPGEVR
jgi:hypothetical protein